MMPGPVAGGLLALALLSPKAAAPPEPAPEMPITTHSPEALALFQRGRDHLANVERARAAELFARAIAADGRFAMAHASRAFSGVGLEQARFHADRAAALADEVSAGERLWIEGVRAEVYGDAAALDGAMRALLAMHPGDKSVQLRAGAVRQGRGDLPGAIRHFEQAAALDPGFAAPHNALGYARLALGDLAGAEAALRRYVELRPTAPNAHDSLGELLLKEGLPDEAMASYRRALALDPAFSSAWDGIGHCHVLRDRYPEARQAFARSAAVSLHLAGRLAARNWRAVSYVHEGRTAEAVASFDELRALADEGGAADWAFGALLDAAWVLLEAEGAKAAAPLLEAAAARVARPSVPEPRRAGMAAEVQRLRAMALVRAGELAAARQLARAGRADAERRGDEAAARGFAGVLAWVELESGDPGAALEQAARAARDSAWVHYLEALAHERLGQVAEARAGFTRVARWNQNDLGWALVRARARARAPD